MQVHRKVVEGATVTMAKAWHDEQHRKRQEWDAMQKQKEAIASAGTEVAPIRTSVPVKTLDMSALSSVHLKRRQQVTRAAQMKIPTHSRHRMQRKRFREREDVVEDSDEEESVKGDELHEHEDHEHEEHEHEDHPQKQSTSSFPPDFSSSSDEDAMDTQRDSSHAQSDSEADQLTSSRSDLPSVKSPQQAPPEATSERAVVADVKEPVFKHSPAEQEAVVVPKPPRKRIRTASESAKPVIVKAEEVEKEMAELPPPMVIVGEDDPLPEPTPSISPEAQQQVREAISQLDKEDVKYVLSAFNSKCRHRSELDWFPALLAAAARLHGKDLEIEAKPEPADEHEEGCARAAGYYRLDASKRKVAHGREQRQPQSRKVMLRQAQREQRVQARRLQSAIQVDDLFQADALKFSQLKNRKKSLRFGRSPIHDWGLFAMEEVPRESMVIEYVGEVIRRSVAEERERRYTVMGIGSSYLFRLDDQFVVDATRSGAIARFMNHSCDVSSVRSTLPDTCT